MPYPFWVDNNTKIKVVKLVKDMIDYKVSGNDNISDYKKTFSDFFQYK
jgi:hypothetical protein